MCIHDKRSQKQETRLEKQVAHEMSDEMLVRTVFMFFNAGYIYTVYVRVHV